MIKIALAAVSFMVAGLVEDEPVMISWSDLVPAGETPAIAPDPDAPVTHDQAGVQRGSTATNTELDGKNIRMPGFMLPLDYTEKGMVTSFLLVPYYGACIHVPPPPPNQIIFVDVGDEPVESRGLWDPVYVSGTMTVQMNINGLGDAAYTLLLDKIEPYD